MWSFVYFDISMFQLTIQAYDLGMPSGISENNARVTIQVARNFNPPKFQPIPYEATLNRDQVHDAPIIDMLASDSDRNVSVL
jgi:hypothetical protein